MHRRLSFRRPRRLAGEAFSEHARRRLHLPVDAALAAILMARAGPCGRIARDRRHLAVRRFHSIEKENAE
jgi:hypothetical protein